MALKTTHDQANKMKKLLLVILVTLKALVSAQADEKPNVLFLMVDDLNDYISVLKDYPGVKTPNLDKFSKSAMFFTQAYCNGVACLPSRSSLLSGMAPNQIGCYENKQPAKFPKEVSFLPSQFQANGYATYGTGKIFHRGTDNNDQWEHYAGKYSLGPKPHKRNIPTEFGLPGLFDYGVWKGSDDDFPDTINADIVIDWLNQEHDKPFFIAYGIHRPHNPWTAPKRFFDMYPLESLVIPEVPADDMDDLPPSAVLMAHTVNKVYSKDGVREFMRSEHYKKTVQAYLACISFMDYNLGRVLDALDESPFAENTIISLVADHGFHMGEKEHFAKFGIWEQTTHILYAWRVPGLTPENGSVCERTVSLADLYPTYIDLCRLTPPPQQKLMHGKSIRSLLGNPQASWNRPVVSTYGFNNHSVRDERWRYSRYDNGDEELYDHAKDPKEWTNLANVPEFAPVKARLAEWLPSTNVEPVGKGGKK